MTRILTIVCLLVVQSCSNAYQTEKVTVFISNDGANKPGCGKSVDNACSSLRYIFDNEHLPPNVSIKFFINGGQHEGMKYKLEETISISANSISMQTLPNTKKPVFVNNNPVMIVPMFLFSKTPNLWIDGIDFENLTPLRFSGIRGTSGSIFLNNTRWLIKNDYRDKIIFIDSSSLPPNLNMSLDISDFYLQSFNKDIPIIRDVIGTYEKPYWIIQIIQGTFLSTGFHMQVNGGLLTVTNSKIWSYVNSDYSIELIGFNDIRMQNINFEDHPPTAKYGLMNVEHVRGTLKIDQIYFNQLGGELILKVNNATRVDITNSKFEELRDISYFLYFEDVNMLNFNNNVIKSLTGYGNFFTANTVMYLNMTNNWFEDIEMFTSFIVKSRYIGIDNTTFLKTKQPLKIINAVNIHLTKCNFVECISIKGGAISVDTGHLLSIDSCTFSRNRADLQAGAIDSENINAEINDSLFEENNAASSGTLRFTGDEKNTVLLNNVNISSPKDPQNIPLFATILENNGPNLTIHGNSNIHVLASRGDIDIFTTSIKINSKFNYYCPSGTNASSKENKIFQCKSCEKGKYSLQAGSLIYVNNENKTNINYNNVQCKDCPSGAECLGIKTIFSKINYWGYIDDSSSVQFILCPEDYCCALSDKCVGINSCGRNREGDICGRCKKDHYVNLFNNECSPKENCTYKAAFWTVFVVLMLVCFFVVAFLPECGRCYKKHCCKKNDNQEELLPKDEMPSKSAILSGLVKILISFYQISFLLRINRPTTGESKFTDIIREILPSIFNLKITIKQISDSICPSERLDEITKLYIRYILPTTFLASTTIALFLLYKVRNVICGRDHGNREEMPEVELIQGEDDDDEEKSMTFDIRCKVFLIRMLLITYTSITTYFLLMTYPEYVKADKKVLFISGVIPYNNHKTMASIVILITWVVPFSPNVYILTRWLQDNKITINQFLLCYCFPPATIVVAIFYKFNMPALQGVEANTNYLLAVFQDPFRIKKSTGKSLLWDHVILFRRFLIALFSVFLANYIIRLGVILPLIFLMCIHHSKVAPYKADVLNRMETTCFYSLSILTGINLFWAFFYVYNLPYQKPVSTFGDVLNVFEIILAFSPFIYGICELLMKCCNDNFIKKKRL